MLMGAGLAGLPKDSAAIVSRVMTVDRDHLGQRVVHVEPALLANVAAGPGLAFDP